MYNFTGFKGVKKKESRPEKQAPKPSLLTAPGVQVGQAIEWGGTSIRVEVTPAEVEFMKRYLKCKTINYPRALAIKQLMTSKTQAQIIKHFRGRAGFSERTIKRYHAALSKAGGVVFM